MSIDKIEKLECDRYGIVTKNPSKEMLEKEMKRLLEVQKVQYNKCFSLVSSEIMVRQHKIGIIRKAIEKIDQQNKEN